MKKANILIIAGFTLFLTTGIASAADLDDLDVTIKMMESNDDVNEMENELHLPDSVHDQDENHNDAHDNDSNDDDREGLESDREDSEDIHDDHEEGVEDSSDGMEDNTESMSEDSTTVM